MREPFFSASGAGSAGFSPLEAGARDICWLCARPLGRKTEWHHPVPKSRGGRQVAPLHPIWHRTVHASFSNAELARLGHDADRLRAHPPIAAFLRWVAGKPPDFHARTAGRRDRR